MLASLLFLQALAAATPAAAADPDDARLAACAAKAETDAEAAYEDAMAWANEAHVRQAAQCAAIALVGLGRYEQGAARLESLAQAADGGAPEARALLLSQAGNAWLLARAPDRAAGAFTAALAHAPREPDLLIDRARARAMLGLWNQAEIDLTAALAIRPQDALALRLRAQTRLEQNVLDLAEKDAEAAVRLEPNNVDALVMRGAVRARRAGR